MPLDLDIFKRNNEVQNNVLTILIHGLNAPFTFTDEDSNWKDFFLSDEKLTFTDVGIVSYDTSLLARGIFSLGNGFKPIEELAQELKSILDLEDYDQYEKITLVGHSMGGLVGIRYLLEEIKRNRQTRIKSFISLATPFNGSHLADFHKLIKWMTPHKQIPQLEPNSDFLGEINRTWIEILENPLVSSIEFTFGYGGDDKIVNKNSAIPFVQTDKWDAVTLNGGHTSILKITKDRLPRSYQLVRDRIRKVNALTDLNEIRKSNLQCVDISIINRPNEIEKFKDQWFTEELAHLEDIEGHFPIVDIKLLNTSNDIIYITQAEIKSKVSYFEFDHSHYMAFPVTWAYNLLLNTEQDETNFINLSQVVNPNGVDRFLIILGIDNDYGKYKNIDFEIEIVLHYNKGEKLNLGKHELTIFPPVLLSTKKSILNNVITFPASIHNKSN
jgi:pimeloyl-ACP methyl ester carboxylesterase